MPWRVTRHTSPPREDKHMSTCKHVYQNQHITGSKLLVQAWQGKLWTNAKQTAVCVIRFSSIKGDTPGTAGILVIGWWLKQRTTWLAVVCIHRGSSPSSFIFSYWPIRPLLNSKLKSLHTLLSSDSHIHPNHELRVRSEAQRRLCAAILIRFLMHIPADTDTYKLI